MRLRLLASFAALCAGVAAVVVVIILVHETLA
jgi:hypothetical protein